MKKRKIFTRKKSIKKYIIYFLISFVLIISLIIFLIFYSKKYSELFIVNENKSDFYIIPKDKEGKTISNTEIRIFNYNDNLNQTSETTYKKYNFSIQLYASTNYDLVLNELTNFENNLSFYKNDFSIVALKHNLGIDYLLIYKNFESKSEAFDYCTKYLNFIENCMIVNIHNLN